MKLKYLGTDYEFDNKIENYVIETGTKNKGIATEFVLQKVTLAAIDENGDDFIGIGGYVQLLCSNVPKEIIKDIKKNLKKKGFEIINLYKDMFETETHVGPDDLDNIFDNYVKTIKLCWR